MRRSSCKLLKTSKLGDMNRSLGWWNGGLGGI
jgi:hypothetical protein